MQNAKQCQQSNFYYFKSFEFEIDFEQCLSQINMRIHFFLLTLPLLWQWKCQQQKFSRVYKDDASPKLQLLELLQHRTSDLCINSFFCAFSFLAHPVQFYLLQTVPLTTQFSSTLKWKISGNSHSVLKRDHLISLLWAENWLCTSFSFQIV